MRPSAERTRMDPDPAEEEPTPDAPTDESEADEPGDATAAADPETVADAAAEIADRVVGGRRSEGGDGSADAGEPSTGEDDGSAGAGVTVEADEPEPLTISLPDGSESVAAAIRSNREMLAAPAENGLAPAEAVTELRETVDRLAEDRPDDLTNELAGLETATERLADRVARQDREIRELREVVRSLAEILGASVEFQESADDGEAGGDGDGDPGATDA
jgi:hypothetical protein